MFDASVKALAEHYPDMAPTIALVGGTQEQRTDWANANVVAPAALLSLDFMATTGPAPVAPHIVLSVEIETAFTTVRGLTFAGAVFFDKHVDDGLLRAIHISLHSAARLTQVKPSELMHFIKVGS